MKTPLKITNFLQPPTTELSHFLAGENQLVICNGVNPSYKKGVLYKDTGYSKVGTTLQANKSVTGLHNFRQTASTQKMLATINNSGGTNLTLQYNNAGTWTAINVGATYDAFEDCTTEMEDFIGYCFIVGYDSTDGVWLPVASLTGTTFSTSTCVTSMPNAKYVKRYRDRLYIANCYNSGSYPYRVYYSSVPSAGAITWTPASDFLDVDFSEEITGINENWDRLLIFTELSAYMYDQESWKKVWDVGGYHRTIRNVGAYMVFANKDNVWASTGGRPAPIGNDILELLRNSDKAYWTADVVEQEYHLYVGNTEANGIAYANCLLTYNLETGMWRWRELYDSITVLARYTASGVSSLYMGTTGGMVMAKGKHTDTSLVTSDNAKPITSHFRTKAYDLGDPSVVKDITKLFAYSEYAQGLSLHYRIFDKNQEAIMPFKPIGNCTKVINQLNVGAKGHFIQFEGKEYSTKQAWRFYGFTALATADTVSI